MLGQADGAYLSPRTYARNLPEAILACAASHAVAGAREPLVAGARDALNYALATKLQMPPTMFVPLHEAAAELLRGERAGTDRDLRLEMVQLQSFEERLAYLEENWAGMRHVLSADEMEKVIGELLRGATVKGESEKLVVLREALARLGYQGDGLRQVDGKLLITLNKAVNLVLPRLAKLDEHQARARGALDGWRQFLRFREMVAAGSFLASRDEQVMKLQMYLIDVYEGDAPDGLEDLLTTFASFELPEAS